jgi:hypothetical protein
MAQQFPTTAQVIYDVLAADSAFLAMLGSYRFRGNSSREIPALSIVTAGEDMPALRRVQGVECIVQDAGNITASSYLTGDQPRLTTSWNVFLVAWEESTGAELQVASEHILKRFAGSRSYQTVATPDGLGSLVQTKVEIKSDMPIL